MERTDPYSKEFRDRAVRLVAEKRGEHNSEWARIRSIAGKMGCTPELLRSWARQAQSDSGERDGLSTDERKRLKGLEREHRELKRSNDILRLASAFSPRTHGRAGREAAGQPRRSLSANDFVTRLVDLQKRP
jgi:transposase